MSLDAPHGEVSRGPAPPLRIKPRCGARAIVLALSGELDLNTVPLFEEAVGAALPRLARPGREGVLPLVVDLTDVPFADSSGVSLLIEAARRVHGLHVFHTGTGKTPAAFAVCSPAGSAVRKSLAILRADRILPVFDSFGDWERAAERATAPAAPAAPAQGPPL